MPDPSDTTGREIDAYNPWVRGPAELADGQFTLERPEPYDAHSTSGLYTVLAGVNTPHDALGFIRQYGLLWHGVDEPGQTESWEEWENAVRTLQLVMAAIGAELGHREHGTLALLPDIVWTGVLASSGVGAITAERMSADERVHFLREWIASAITHHTAGNELATVWHPDRGWAQILRAPNLLAIAYLQLAQDLGRRIPMRPCEDCGRLFAIHHRRQRFCTPTCATRARDRRRRQKL